MVGCTRPGGPVLATSRARDAYPPSVGSPRDPVRSRRVHVRERDHRRGRQDPSEAHGQDPRSVLPCRRHGLAHQARWPGDRGDRQVPPHRRAVGHRDRLRPRAALAEHRRPADRGRRGAAEGHRRLAEVQGPPRCRGHPAGRRAEEEQEGALRGRGRRCRWLQPGRQGHPGPQEGRPAKAAAPEGCRGSRCRGPAAEAPAPRLRLPRLPLPRPRPRRPRSPPTPTPVARRPRATTTSDDPAATTADAEKSES